MVFLWFSHVDAAVPNICMLCIDAPLREGPKTFPVQPGDAAAAGGDRKLPWNIDSSQGLYDMIPININDDDWQ